ncbi:uncharacterized protein TM35_000041090 [Trypanosoma theileri]|uniref:Uncharacterized protein n=1 Tax=Trypanosoma theileri TaxID=67003 RepID=A0A1X0P4U6_9TRYP|nr:uncharacterized protein TM35_000041090 [Trypanosoma theileri]ORC91895.1 hypothetical protein TM35_000041090 [Trypanosoma theileri]
MGNQIFFLRVYGFISYKRHAAPVTAKSCWDETLSKKVLGCISSSFFYIFHFSVNAAKKRSGRDPRDSNNYALQWWKLDLAAEGTQRDEKKIHVLPPTRSIVISLPMRTPHAQR